MQWQAILPAVFKESSLSYLIKIFLNNQREITVLKICENSANESLSETSNTEFLIKTFPTNFHIFLYRLSLEKDRWEKHLFRKICFFRPFFLNIYSLLNICICALHICTYFFLSFHPLPMHLLLWVVTILRFPCFIRVLLLKT